MQKTITTGAAAYAALKKGGAPPAKRQKTLDLAESWDSVISLPLENVTLCIQLQEIPPAPQTIAVPRP